MHPVRSVFVAGCKVWAIHHDESHHLVGLGDGTANAETIAIGLGMLWHVPVKRVNANVLDVDVVIYTPGEVEAVTEHIDGEIDSPAAEAIASDDVTDLPPLAIVPG